MQLLEETNKGNNQIVITNALNEMIKDDAKYNNEILKCLDRHLNNDFGDLEQEDKDLNTDVLKDNLNNGRVVSKYITSKADIYIITENYKGYDNIKLLTTIMLTSDY